MVNFCCARCQCHQYLAARYAQEAECCRAVFPLLLHYTIEFTFKGNCRISLCKLVALEKNTSFHKKEKQRKSCCYIKLLCLHIRVIAEFPFVNWQKKIMILPNFFFLYRYKMVAK